jgi:crotonobetainyl-CoA:carnitine CoA-transferase CaiB-like acyl-CoA transferase
MSQPLAGIRVVDLTRLLPGAYATLLLVDLGAEVIKVEDPRGGDGMRGLGARLTPSRYADPAATFFALLNRGKRSVTLDLRRPEAAGVLDALLSRADAVVDSFRPSTARRLGVDAEALRARHPRLVCASITGFGRSGPYAEVAAHDINYQALAGLLTPPALPGPLVGDIGAAHHAALQIVAALLLRQQTGAGSSIDVAIHEAALAWSLFPATGDLESACYTIYETADGEWVALGALEPKFWRGFCERIGRADLIPLQHATGADGARVADEVRAVLRGRTRAEWLARFADADVCLTPIYTPQQVAGDPHVAARKLLPTLSTAPALGADTDVVMEESGVPQAARDALRAAGVI